MRKTSRWLHALCFAFPLVAVLSCGGPPATDVRPNIVLLVGDDHGYPYFGFMGSQQVQTPHLDALADESLVFTHGFNSSSECRPSLVTLLTGLHPMQWRAKLEALRERGIDRGRFGSIVDFETLPRLLSAHGYATFQGGKYWEGSYDMGGFTHGMTTTHGLERAADFGQIQAHAGADGLALARKTLQPLWDFLDAHHETPFLVWFAPKLPHTPHDAPASYLERYANQGLGERAQRYYANVSRFDDAVGELMAYLDRNGLRDNTVVVYLSDNGWEQGPTEQYFLQFLGGPKGKLSMHELGFRTPILFRWPGHIEPGRDEERLVIAEDLFPTLLAAAGVNPPPARTGSNLLPLLTGSDELPPRAQVFGSTERQRLPVRKKTRSDAIDKWLGWGPAHYTRTNRWRYIWYEARDREELYDLATDPEETVDVAAAHPEITGRFRADIEGWLRDLPEVPITPP